MIDTCDTGLMQHSSAYKSKAAIYELFAQAEDAGRLISGILRKRMTGKRVLDIGCGTGKYLSVVAPVAAEYLGIDAAADALRFACAKAAHFPNASVRLGKAEALPFSSQSFDCAFACWVLGTIADDSVRYRALSEVRRVLKKGGVFYLIENAIGGEFEMIRGRYPDSARTERYNEWLEQNGAEIAEAVTCSFRFASLIQAREVFMAIWGAGAARKVVSREIEHRVVVYEIRADPIL